MKLVVVLFAALIAISLSADCNNPLLADATIKANIGASNIATSVQTAGSSLPICKWLAGKQVCATSYDALATAISNKKAEFKTASDARNKARWGSVSTDVDLGDCLEKIYFSSAFFAYAFGHGWTGSGTTNIDFNGFGAQLETSWDAFESSSEYQAQLDAAEAELDQIDTLIEGYIGSKANCSTAIFQWVIYINCLATDADYSGKIEGSGSNVEVVVKDGTCDQFRDKCRPYFQHAGQFAEYAVYGAMCNNDVLADLTSDLKADWSADVNARLNAYLNNNELTSGGIFGGSGSIDANTFVGLSCGENSNAGDCDFICDRVLTSGGNGFRQNAFLNLNYGLDNRLLQSSRGPEERTNGPDMFAQTANEDATVEEDDDPTGSNGFKLFAGLSFLLGLVFVL